MFTCPDCEFSSKKFSLLQRHLQIHDKSRKYSCSFCEHKTRCHSNMYQHINLVHKKILKYKCQHCGRKCFRASDLRRHLLTLHKIVNEICSVCSGCFRDKEELLLHISTQHPQSYSKLSKLLNSKQLKQQRKVKPCKTEVGTIGTLKTMDDGILSSPTMVKNERLSMNAEAFQAKVSQPPMVVTENFPKGSEIRPEERICLSYSSDIILRCYNSFICKYDLGLSIPFILRSPNHKHLEGKRSNALASLLDITPTILDWFGLSYPPYSILHGKEHVRLTGRSLLSVICGEDLMDVEPRAVFGSHNLHEITMNYPMRYVRTSSFKLIHNLANLSPFPIDQDFYISNSFQDLLQRTRNNASLHWIKTLNDYYYRDEWELFDLNQDPLELANLAKDPSYKATLKDLKFLLYLWQKDTDDPWICGSHAVLEDKGHFKTQPSCLPLYNRMPEI